MPLMLFPRRGPIVISVALATAHVAVVLIAHPGWQTTVVVTMGIAALSICVAAAALMSPGRRLARQTDEVIDRVDAEEHEVLRARILSDAHTESIRLLHDTVVNTLGALAREEVGRQPPASVRRRCRRDVEQVTALLDPQAREAHSAKRFFELDGLGLLPVRLEGMGLLELRRHEALLPAPVAHALRGCLVEAARNATKHSGAEHLVLTTRRVDHDLVVEARDDGVGFDGEPIPGRGLAESVFARARDHGIRVRLATAPGRGTALEFRYALDQQDGGLPQRVVSADAVIDGLRRRLCWTWAIAILGAGLLRALATTVDRFPDPLVVVGASVVLSLLAWLATRRGRQLPGWLTVVILLTCPLVGLVALHAVDFGRTSPYLFDGLTLTPLLVLLLVLRRKMTSFAVALALLVLIVPGSAWLHPELEAPDVQMQAVMMAAPMGVLLAWIIWYSQIGVVGRTLARGRQRSWEAHQKLAARAAAESARARWNAASLEPALEVLRGVAAGTLTPGDPEVRKRCADEERQLRETISLRPHPGSMSNDLALALAIARSRSVRFRLQPGAAEPADLRATRAFGRLAVVCVGDAAPDSEVILSVIDGGGAPRLFIVGDGLRVTRADDLPAIPGCHVRVEALGPQTLLEATWHDPASSTAGADAVRS